MRHKITIKGIKRVKIKDTIKISRYINKFSLFIDSSVMTVTTFIWILHVFRHVYKLK